MTNTDASTRRIYLSPPHVGELERELVDEAFDSNWITSLGPQVDAFEMEFADRIGSTYAVALSSGTAALHLALLLVGVERGDVVLVSTLTFAASAFPICYIDAIPWFVDSEFQSWNMDPGLLRDALKRCESQGRHPKAVVLVHLYGQCADIDSIREVSREFGVPVIEDAAEALGATYKDRSPGNTGVAGIFSFNGNKIITTSGGGMLVTGDQEIASNARKLAAQAREPTPYYEHKEIGFNYRLSNISAAIGRGQLRVLDERVEARRENFRFYREGLEDLEGLSFMPEASWGRHSRWLTCLLIDPVRFGVDREELRLALEARNIESRPLWKPMHLQPVFHDAPVTGGSTSENLFRDGLCLPSGSSLTKTELTRVISVIRDYAKSQ